MRARLADLLWVRRHQPSRRWFKVAVRAYVQLAETNVEVLNIGCGLQRAVAICTELNHSELRRDPLEALEHLVKRHRDSWNRLDRELSFPRFIDSRRPAHRKAGAWPGLMPRCSELVDLCLRHYGAGRHREH